MKPMLFSGCAVVLGAMASARAEMIGLTFTPQVLWDIDANTGASSNPRPVTGLPLGGTVTGVTFGATPNDIFTVTTAAGGFGNNSLFRINRATGAATRIGSNYPRSIFEGDVRYNPSDGFIYALYGTLNAVELLRIDPNVGASGLTPLGLSGLGLPNDLNGLAFHPITGDMYIMDGRGGTATNDRIYRVSLATGAVLSTLLLDRPESGGIGGIEFDSAGNLYYVAGEGGDGSLYHVDLTTGATSPVGDTGITNLAGIALIPSPPTATAVVALLIPGCRRRRREAVSA